MMRMIQLKTRWADTVNEENVLPEYPRPNLKRNSYFNLNGKWDYCINQSKEPNEYEGEILVPYSPETLLSGVQKRVAPGDYLHYRKVFCFPQHQSVIDKIIYTYRLPKISVFNICFIANGGWIFWVNNRRNNRFSI